MTNVWDELRSNPVALYELCLQGQRQSEAAEASARFQAEQAVLEQASLDRIAKLERERLTLPVILSSEHGSTLAPDELSVLVKAVQDVMQDKARQGQLMGRTWLSVNELISNGSVLVALKADDLPLAVGILYRSVLVEAQRYMSGLKTPDNRLLAIAFGLWELTNYIQAKAR